MRSYLATIKSAVLTRRLITGALIVSYCLAIAPGAAKASPGARATRRTMGR